MNKLVRGFLFAVICLAAAPAWAVPIERVISPGGIEAWLVRQETVPLISLEFAFVGGASPDPANKPGVANMSLKPASSHSCGSLKR